MKKILALLTVMCMTVVILASCGSGASDYYDTKYGYIEDLAKAIDDDDDDKIDDIKDDIKAYWEEYSDKMEEIYDDTQDKYEDEMDEMNDLESDISDADIKDSAREAVEDAMSAGSTALSKVSTANPDAIYDILDTMIDGYRDIAKAADDEDSDKVKKIARDLKKEFNEIIKEYEEYEKEYDDKIAELKDEYGEKTVNKAISEYSSSMY